jgi:saccharopine dehydrogenase (NAD+, L-lysine-forming)
MLLGVGGVGTVIAKKMAERDSFEEVMLADVETSWAQRLRDEIDDQRFSVAMVNAADVGQMTQALSGMDMVINAVLPRFNLQIMEAAVSARVHYLDMASDGMPPGARPENRLPIMDQLAYDGKFKDAGRMAVLCMGVDPGCTNVFARYGADQLDRVDKILVRDGDNGRVEGYRFALYFSPDTVIDECIVQPPMVYEDGRFVLGKPLETGIEDFVFPEPLGKMRVYSVAHEEVETLPRNIKKGLRYCDFKYALDDQMVEVLKVLNLLGLDRPDPVSVKGVEVVPRDVVTALLPKPIDLGGKIKGWSCVGSVIRGAKASVEKEYYVYTMSSHDEAYQRLGVNATVYQTGIPPVVIAEMIAEGAIQGHGVFCPEQFDAQPIMQRLPEMGLPVYTRESSLVKRGE